MPRQLLGRRGIVLLLRRAEIGQILADLGLKSAPAWLIYSPVDPFGRGGFRARIWRDLSKSAPSSV